MKFGMYVIGEVTGRTSEHGWLQFYDPDGADGAGVIQLTMHPKMARQFDSVSAVLACWKQVSTVRPVRLDGRPNRPLSAYTIEAKQLP